MATKKELAEFYEGLGTDLNQDSYVQTRKHVSKTVDSLIVGSLKIEASARLQQAMLIQKGDNFADAKKNSKLALSKSGSEYEILEKLEDFVLLRRVVGMAHWYVLVKPKDNFEAKLNQAKTLKSLITSVVGLIVCIRFPKTDEVYSIFVDENFRGVGFGQKLYGIAHKYSKKGLESSDDLGTMSLGTWLALYKRNDKIQFVINQKKIPRKSIVVHSVYNIEWTVKARSLNIVATPDPIFKLFWPK